jgi:hypothetical protein
MKYFNKIKINLIKNNGIDAIDSNGRGVNENKTDGKQRTIVSFMYKKLFID